MPNTVTPITFYPKVLTNYNFWLKQRAFLEDDVKNSILTVFTLKMWNKGHGFLLPGLWSPLKNNSLKTVAPAWSVVLYFFLLCFLGMSPVCLQLCEGHKVLKTLYFIASFEIHNKHNLLFVCLFICVNFPKTFTRYQRFRSGQPGIYQLLSICVISRWSCKFCSTVGSKKNQDYCIWFCL